MSSLTATATSSGYGWLVALGWRGPATRALFRGLAAEIARLWAWWVMGVVAAFGPVAVSRPCRERRCGHFGAGRSLGRYSALSLLLLRAVREMCMILGLGGSGRCTSELLSVSLGLEGCLRSGGFPSWFCMDPSLFLSGCILSGKMYRNANRLSVKTRTARVV